MNDFDYDCAQKKRIAKSAHNHVNARRGKCKLPHEYLTRKELEKLNGEVKNYNLKEPMDWATLKTMPDDLKKQYIEDLQERFHANDGMLAEMLGCSRQNVLLHRRRLGIKGFPRGKTPEEEQLKAWKTWMGEEPPVSGELYPGEFDSCDDDGTAADEPVKTAPPVLAGIQNLRVHFGNAHSWEELYAMCKQLPFPEHPAQISLEVW